MGVATVAESQQRPSGSGVTTGTGDRTIINRPKPAKTAETPPLERETY